jgi:hypothetical protein
MRNPWTTKNPFMSLWLSAANRVAGSARGQAAAAVKRQTAKQMADFWSPPAVARKKKKVR